MNNKKQSNYSKLIEELVVETILQVHGKYIGDQLSFEQKVHFIVNGPSGIAVMKEHILKLEEYLLMRNIPGDELDMHVILALNRVVFLLDFLQKHTTGMELKAYIKDPDHYASPYERWLRLLESK